MHSFPFKDWLRQLRERAGSATELTRSLHCPPTSWLHWIEDCTSTNGYRREDALKRIAGLPVEVRAQALRFVLARLNDWVAPVRTAANTAAIALLVDDLELVWIEELPAVVALLRAGRSDQRAFIEQVQTFFFSSPSRRRALMQAMPSYGVAARRWVAQSGWLAGTLPERTQGLVAALTGPDAVVARAALAVALAADSEFSSRPEVLAALNQIRLPRLRLLVLRQRQAEGQFPPPDAVALALGPHRATREWLCFHADTALKERLREACVSALSGSCSDRPSGLRGAALETLYLVDSRACQPWISSLQTDAEPRTRLSAFHLALKAASGTERGALALRTLADPAPKLRKLGVRAIRRGHALCDTSQLLALGREHPDAWPQVLSAAQVFGAVAGLRMVLQLTLLRNEIPKHLHRALHAASARLRRSVYAPSESESVELAALWSQAITKHPNLKEAQ
ncbi:hypothetical protein [Inhella proteolytica]|uniref:HEAT repeat domain-containing protein n=1 Tax=Inhella proteolytica TaxID=2795029 RepID=A0A931NHM7_9BURK|nr:hypothetical protein [Inhella proteolytica]MBH9576680.1 hypothetical protein [Inhella proteolytica]